MSGLEIPEIIGVGFLLFVVCKIIKSIMAKPLLCPNCLNQSKPKTKIRGSILIEIILWLCLIIPGLIYSLWRSGSRYKVCPSCNATGMMVVDPKNWTVC